MARSHKNRNWDKKRNRSRNMRGGAVTQANLDELQTKLASITKFPDGSEYKGVTFVLTLSEPENKNEMVINDANYQTVMDDLATLSTDEKNENDESSLDALLNEATPVDDSATPADDSATPADGVTPAVVGDGASTVAEGSTEEKKEGGKKNKKNKSKKGGKSQKRNKNKKGKQNNSKKRR